MKYLKQYESFADDIINKVGDENKEIQRPDLKDKVYNYRGLPDLEVLYAVEFLPSGTFNAISNAEYYLKDMGYNVGSDERNSPIGFSSGVIVPKWSNITPAHRELLDGAMIPLPEFREGGVLVLFYSVPKF